MKDSKIIDIQNLLEQAEKSQNKESFTVLKRSHTCRIGVGVRLESSNQPSLFLEVLVKLCSGLSDVDLNLIEKGLMLLNQLKSRGYSMNCEEDGCISCELAVPKQNLIRECEDVSSLAKKCQQLASTE